MRKAAAILLLPIMMIFAIQPVIAMHYCGGELRSLNLFLQQTATELCPVHAADQGDGHSCCDSHRAETDYHNCDLHTTGEKCCDIELFELTTDDYQNKIEQLVSRILSLSIDNVGALLTGLFRLAEPETDIRTPLQDFPPGGLFLKDVSILTYICIYRI